MKSNIYRNIFSLNGIFLYYIGYKMQKGKKKIKSIVFSWDIFYTKSRNVRVQWSQWQNKRKELTSKLRILHQVMLQRKYLVAMFWECVCVVCDKKDDLTKHIKHCEYECNYTRCTVHYYTSDKIILNQIHVQMSTALFKWKFYRFFFVVVRWYTNIICCYCCCCNFSKGDR